MSDGSSQFVRLARDFASWLLSSWQLKISHGRSQPHKSGLSLPCTEQVSELLPACHCPQVGLSQKLSLINILYSHLCLSMLSRKLDF